METKPTWQLVWEKGFQPQFSTEALESLAKALETDDPRLCQGSTTIPVPLMALEDWECEACCPVSWAGVLLNGGFATAVVGQVEEFFAKACYQCDQTLGEPAACRWFLNAWDTGSRSQMRSELLAVIKEELNCRYTEWAIRRQMHQPLRCDDLPEIDSE